MSTTSAAPHRGTMIRLPEDKGFVELVNEPEVGDRRKLESTSIVAYFLQIDGKSALDPPPADVSFSIESGAGKGGRGKQNSANRIPLTAQPKPDDPLGAGRLRIRTRSLRPRRHPGYLDGKDCRPRSSRPYSEGVAEPSDPQKAVRSQILP